MTGNVPELKFEVVDNLERLQEIRPDWINLATESAHDTPYILPQFVMPWLRRLDGRYSLHFVLLWRHQQLVGLAPLVERTVSRLGIKLLIRGFPDADPSPVSDIFVRANEFETIEALVAFVLAQPSWDRLEFSFFPASSPTMVQLERSATGAGLSTRSVEREPIYTINLTGNWEDFHTARTKKMRQNLRRGRRYCEAKGELNYRNYPGDMDFSEAIAYMTTILVNSWKNHETEGGWNSFLVDLVTELDACEELLLRFIFVDRQPIAYMVDTTFKSDIFALHNAYDLNFAPANPGQLMLAYCIEMAFEGPWSTYYTGYQDYIRRWSKDSVGHRDLHVTNRSFSTRMKTSIYDYLHNLNLRRIRKRTEKIKFAQKQTASSTYET